MATLLDKLNLKDQAEIVVIDAPASFEPELARLKGVGVVRDVKKARSIAFLLAFRLVAIDEEDWSAMRFRRAEFIRTLKRDPARAMSKSGKARSSEKEAL